MLLDIDPATSAIVNQRSRAQLGEQGYAELSERLAQDPTLHTFVQVAREYASGDDKPESPGAPHRSTGD